MPPVALCRLAVYYLISRRGDDDIKIVLYTFINYYRVYETRNDDNSPFHPSSSLVLSLSRVNKTSTTTTSGEASRNKGDKKLSCCIFFREKNFSPIEGSRVGKARECRVALPLPPSSLCNRHGSKYPGCVVIVHRPWRREEGEGIILGEKIGNIDHRLALYKYTPRYTVPREQSGHRASEQRPASNRSDIEISRIGLISSG